MPLKKVGEVPGGKCFHPEHNPPRHIVLDEGVYEYSCPGCGFIQHFTITRPRW